MFAFQVELWMQTVKKLHQYAVGAKEANFKPAEFMLLSYSVKQML